MRQRFVQSFSTSGTEREAIDAERLGKPYVAFIYAGEYIDWNTLSPTPPVPPEPIYSAMPLTFEILSGGTISWKTNDYTSTFNVYPRTIEYSKDGGNTWTSITSASGSNAPSISVAAGDIIQFRGDNSKYGGQNGYEHSKFLGDSSVKFNIYGNLYSLISKTNYTDITTIRDRYALNYLFYGNSGLISAKNLTLLATSLTFGTYLGLFKDCTSLVDTPELPATTIGESCYEGMFRGCTKITKAPALPASTLPKYCYMDMFNGCTRLNYVECMATTFGTMSTSGWLLDVRSSGRFVKHPTATWTTGENGIPSGWTVVDAE